MPVDPLAGGTGTPNVAAIIAGELTALAADAKTLGARVATGDIVQATVLPSNGLTDLLEIDGLRVAAELPPTLLPGERIEVEVIGMQADRIELHILATSTGSATGARTVVDTTAGETPDQQRIVTSPGARILQASFTAGAAVRGPMTPPAAAPIMRTRLAAPPVGELKAIEARIAAARAASPPVSRPPVVSTAPASAKAPSNGPARPAPLAVSVVQRPLIEPRPTPPLSVGVPRAAAVARGPAAYAEPAALLRALRLPVTATNIASARMALDAPDKLPGALTTLERALGNSADPRITTLSTLTSFIARLDPRSPVLGTQIAAFVENVVTGGEAKLAQFAHAAAPAEPSTADDAHPANAGESLTALAPERGALLRAMLDSDLKTQLLALAADVDVASTTSEPAAFNAIVAGAITAMSAVQLTAAATLAANPDGLAFTLPVALPDGYAQARVRIDRDRSAHTNEALDGDNFHIAFVLETRHLGTIGIDVVTVGRAVTLSVKTEAARAQRVFGAALGDLTSRLETLRYRVAKADAVIAPTPDAAIVPKESAGPVVDPARLVDIDA